MTNEDYSKVPPPHLLKKFSEQAREDSQKRGRPGYCKTFAKLCIDWALNSKSSPNNLQIRSSVITPPSELVQQWRSEWIHNAPGDLDELGFLAQRAAQWGADQELEACCEWLKAKHWIEPEFSDELRAARRPKPPSLKEQALAALNDADIGPGAGLNAVEVCIIRRALEQLDD
jgi:hypothetical protein